MRLYVTGIDGQVGHALVRRAHARGHEVVGSDVGTVDLRRPEDLERALASFDGDAVINAAAYTAVDKAESEPALAFAVNRDGAGHLAAACRRRGLRFLHISTDYVFDGAKATPYVEDDPMCPLGVYGRSKAEGETAVLAADPAALVVRTSWVFGLEGVNFVRTMVRLARERAELRVVGDQRGCPTFADDLADALLTLAAHPQRGLLHFACDGATTWHGFAEAIVAGARARAQAQVACERITAITTAEYPTPARRPPSSVLATDRARALGLAPPSWRPGLDLVLDALLGRRP